MDKELLKTITRNTLPVVSDIKKEAAAALLDEQKPYEIFEGVAFQDPCICINLYRAIGEKRPDKETEHITLSTLANIYGINALRNKMSKFSELEKTSLSNVDKAYCMHIYLRSTHLALQVLKLSKLIGYEYPKQLSIAALLFSSGELHYAASRIDDKKYDLSLKEKVQLNHATAMQFNLPVMTKQSTGKDSSSSYQSEIIYWSYRYLISLETFDAKSEIESQNKLAEIVCINTEKIHHHLTQLSLNVARDNLRNKAFMKARYILFQHYENKINSAERQSMEKHVSDSGNSQAKKFISWLLGSKQEDGHNNKAEVIKNICEQINTYKPADVFLLIKHSQTTRLSKVIWSSGKNQVDLQALLQPEETKDILIDILCKKDKSINITTTAINDRNLDKLYKASFLQKLAATQLVICPIYEDFDQELAQNYNYLFCVANTNDSLDKDQINIAKIIRHYFRKHYVDVIPEPHVIQKPDNIVQISRQ